MLIDGEDFFSESGGKISVQVAVVGAGAAGITTAMDLSRRGLNVLVLEAGGIPPHESRDQFFAGESVGQTYNLVETRDRALGGTTNLWGGWCRPLDPYEMEFHPWVGGLPWPMSHRELTRYSTRAGRMLDLGPWQWNAARIASSQGHGSLNDVRGSELLFAPVVWRFASRPLSFAERYAAFLNGPQSRIVLNAPVTNVNAHSDVARSLEVTLGSGRKMLVTFETLILAAGGIENVRLLLEMQAQLRSAGQAVDRSGWLGRGWQEHPHVSIGTAFVSDSVAEGPLWLFTDRRNVDGVPVLAGLSFPKSVLERKRMAATSVTAVRNQVFSPAAVPFAAGIRYLAERVSKEQTQTLDLFARSESRTVRSSRISLASNRDPIGRRRVRLDWRLSDGDFRDLRLTASLIGQAFAKLRLGVVHKDVGRQALARRMRGGAHHIGGARMSKDPERGVTDEYGALHQMSNVFVTGSATFPSGGFSNPTLTIMALALRQAEFIATSSAS